MEDLLAPDIDTPVLSGPGQPVTSHPYYKNCVFDAKLCECTVCLSGEVSCSCQTKGNTHLLFVDQYNNLTLSNQSIFRCTGAHWKTKQTQLRRGERRRREGGREGELSQINCQAFLLQHAEIGRGGKLEESLKFSLCSLSKQPREKKNDTAKFLLCAEESNKCWHAVCGIG